MISTPNPPNDGRPHKRRPLPVLRSSREFRRVYEEGRKTVSALLIVHIRPRSDDVSAPARLGLTVSRKCGNACVRNRIRRRIRECIRTAPEAILPGRDIVLTARPSAADATFSELRSQVLACLAKMGGVIPHG